MVTREKLYTVQEFLAYVREDADTERRLELEHGVVIEMPPSRPINTIIGYRIGTFLNVYVMKNKLGYVTGPDGGYKLSGDTMRQPDAAFVSRTRYATPPEVFEGGPDIAIEIVSPREDVLKKAAEYLAAGTKLVWAIYPDEQVVHVLRATGQRWDELSLSDTLTGEDVLPGFSLAVREIFPSTAPDAD